MAEKPTLLKTYETVCVLAFASLLAGLWFKQPLLLYLSLVLLFSGIFVKPAAVWVAWGWLKFAHLIGSFNAKVILGLIFYLVLTPIALCYRLLYGDSLKIKHKATDSNWTSRDHTYTKEDLEKAW